MLRDYKLSNIDNFILAIRNIARHLSIPEERVLHMDPTSTIVEKVPIIINQPVARRIERD
jgi:hypothetical protein